jgi:hypothetical protein
MHVDSLHQAESRHHQHEQQRHPFPEERATELGIFLHSAAGRSCTIQHLLDAKVAVQEARSADSSATTRA